MTTPYDPALSAQLATELLEDSAETNDEAPFMWSSGAARRAGEQLRAAIAEVARLKNLAVVVVDGHWDEVIAERDALRAEVDQLQIALKLASASVERPSGCRCDLWPRGYCRQGCPSENAELKASLSRLAALEQELMAYRPLYGFAEVWAAENEPQHTDGERKLAQAILDCRTKLRSLSASKTEDEDAAADEKSRVSTENLRRIQAELRRAQERELAFIEERASLRDRLERQAKWLAWPQYGEIGAAAALRRAVVEACDIGLSWSGSDTVDGRRLRNLKDFALRSNEDLAQEEAARKQDRGVGPYRAGDP